MTDEQWARVLLDFTRRLMVAQMTAAGLVAIVMAWVGYDIAKAINRFADMLERKDGDNDRPGA